MTTTATAPLAELLRAELSGYGGLLALFDRQQAALLRRDPQSVADLSAAIEDLVRETAAARSARERDVATLAREHGRDPATSLTELLDAFPADERPLIQALVEEINRLLRVARRRSRQNHAILQRAVELQREMLSSLRPDAFTRTYAPGGRVTAANAVRSTLQATG